MNSSGQKLAWLSGKAWLANLTASQSAAGADMLAQSRAARIGARIINTAKLVSVIEPALAIVAVCLLSAGNAFAQTPGGNIFGSDQQVGNAIREAIKWGRNLLFLMGVVFVGWGVVNYGTEKPAGKQIIAAIGCFAFGGIVALVYSISQGNAVNFDTGFGN